MINQVSYNDDIWSRGKDCRKNALFLDVRMIALVSKMGFNV